ncbi:hypothetical protein GOC53_28045 [Sinorhizobium medicae]|nr:hypothetical protein [Sinorhizobium medicae]MDX0532979.1 hypothetical protein [Sinorhizobium medicae]MDX0998855.1 hypothetical protein [Sinorhizobium medicae]MDX1182800.1 hypothetical protein [Sinorhizobium medicae]
MASSLVHAAVRQESILQGRRLVPILYRNVANPVWIEHTPNAGNDAKGTMADRNFPGAGACGAI